MYAAPTADRLRRHPSGLYYLAGAEACERGGFYLLLALFTLYLNEKLHFTEKEASGWYGNYLAAAYLSALPGGWLAGRWGQRRQWVVLGALLLGVGYWWMGLGRDWLGWAIGLLVVGNSLFKPNISALVGALYGLGDPRRNEGYSVFYLSINLGGFAAPLVGEFARGRYGWSAAFGLAGGALVLSTIMLLLGWRHLPTAKADTRDLAVDSTPQDAQTATRERRQLSRALVILLICAVALVPFWAVFQLNGSALTFWARDNTVRVFHIVGVAFEIPPGVFAAVNPLIVCLLALPVSRTFAYLRRSGVPVTTGGQLLLGVLFTALGCTVMFAAAKLGGNTGRVSQLWLDACYLLHSVGELCLSPVGLAMVSQIAPPRYTGVLMGVWFGITAVGNKLAGVAGSQWASMSHSTFFLAATLVLLGAASLLALCLPWLNRKLPEVH